MAPTNAGSSTIAWPPPPGSGFHTLIFSESAWAWLVDNQRQQDQRLDELQADLTVLRTQMQSLMAYLTAPTALTLLVQDRRPTGMATNIPDTTFFAHVVATDAAGRLTTDPNPLTWTVAPPEAAIVGVDPNHPTETAFAQVVVAAPDAGGNQADFTLHVDDGAGLTANSDVLHPVPGLPTNLVVELSSD